MSRPTSKSDQTTARQFAIMIGLLILTAILLIVIASVVYNRAPKETNPNHPAQVSARIVPAGAVYAGDTGRAAMQAAAAAATKAAAGEVAYGGTTDGKEIYDHLCTSCHTSGVAGAPKTGIGLSIRSSKRAAHATQAPPHRVAFFVCDLIRPEASVGRALPAGHHLPRPP